MVTMMMFYRHRASPKHRYNIIEVDYGGGGHRTRLGDQLSIVVSLGCPLPLYIKEQGGRGGRPGRARQGGSPTPTGSRTPPFLEGAGEGGKEEVERRKGGRRPPLLVLFGLGGGARGPALATSPLFH